MKSFYPNLCFGLLKFDFGSSTKPWQQEDELWLFFIGIDPPLIPPPSTINRPRLFNVFPLSFSPPPPPNPPSSPHLFRPSQMLRALSWLISKQSNEVECLKLADSARASRVYQQSNHWPTFTKDTNFTLILSRAPAHCASSTPNRKKGSSIPIRLTSRGGHYLDPTSLLSPLGFLASPNTKFTQGF